MSKITSTLVRLGVTATFKDGSSSLMHGQVEGDQSWSIDQIESFETARQVSWFVGSDPFHDAWPYWIAIIDGCMKIPGINNFDFDDNPSTYPKRQKIITDMVGRIEVILSFDDGRHASATVILDGVNSNIYFGGESAPSVVTIDLAPFIAKFTVAMNEAMEEVNVN